MALTRQRAAIFGAAIVLFGFFFSLGVWQLERRAWKVKLIDRVEHRVAAQPVDAPRPGEWPFVTASSYEYRRIRARGEFLPGAPTFIQALTELGTGFWVIAPLQMADSSVVLVNLGFVSALQAEGSSSISIPTSLVTVTGLLRLTEPSGRFLRRNDPSENRWYSRDVAAIAAARGLRLVAPYFIDADRATAPFYPGEPLGGLTVINFPNNHLAYAITWFALASLVLVAIFIR